MRPIPRPAHFQPISISIWCIFSSLVLFAIDDPAIVPSAHLPNEKETSKIDNIDLDSVWRHHL